MKQGFSLHTISCNTSSTIEAFVFTCNRDVDNSDTQMLVT